MAQPLQFGSSTYRLGAQERIDEARLLAERGRYALSVYVGGLAVEGMLRSLHWLKDKKFDERHDLKKIATRVQDLGLLRTDKRDHDFVGMVQSVAKYWRNSLRFAGTDQLERFLGEVEGIRKRRHDSIKRFCGDYWANCSAVVKRCEVLWQRSRKNN